MASDQWLAHTACRVYAYHILGSGARLVSFGSSLAASQYNCVCVTLSRVYQPFPATLQQRGRLTEHADFCKRERVVAPECQPLKELIPLLYRYLII